jgi:hypothetical protein
MHSPIMQSRVESQRKPSSPGTQMGGAAGPDTLR